MNARYRFGVSAALIVVVLLASCASSPPARTGPDPDVFHGVGQDASLGQALNLAKMDAVKSAVISMIGADAEKANGSQLNDVLYSTHNPNAFVYIDTMQTLRKDNTGTIDDPKFIYEISIRVNRPAIQGVLDANGIHGAGAPAASSGGGSAQAGNGAKSGQSQSSVAAGGSDLAVQEGDFAAPTPQDMQFIRRYVDSMTYMVYFNDQANADAFLMKSAVTQANSYLASNGMNAVDYAQVESLKKDQQMVYEQETGKEIGLIQWIAQKLNADVYIELDAQIATETSGSNFYGTANLTLKMFEASTGQLLGSVPFRSQRTLSRVNVQDAAANALQSAVWQAMPVAVQQSRDLLAKQFARGIRYDLTIQNASDARVISDFRRKLRSRVSDLQTVTQAAQEVHFAVFYFGRGDELQDLIYTIGESTPGMENINLVLARGKSLTFDTGM